MSQSSVLESRGAGIGPDRGLYAWLRAIEVWLNRRQGLQDLSELDDRLLEDIGVSREEVGQIGEPFWR